MQTAGNSICDAACTAHVTKRPDRRAVQFPAHVPWLISVVAAVFGLSASVHAADIASLPIVFENANVDGSWSDQGRLRTKEGGKLLKWIAPAHFQPGYYYLEFMGTAWELPALSNTADRDMYSGVANRRGAIGSELQKVRIQFYRKDGLRYLPADDNAGSTQSRDSLRCWWRSSVPFWVENETALSVQMNQPGAVIERPALVRASASEQVALSISSSQEFNCFTERDKDGFSVRLRNLTNQDWHGKIEIRHTDGIDGAERVTSENLTIAANSSVELLPEIQRANGVYSLTIRVIADTAKTVAELTRYYSYSPHITAAELPDSWPWGFHLKPEDPLPPPCGFKWIRIFRPSWYEIEPRRGEFDWSVLDSQIARCSAAGYPVLYTGIFSPDWSRPGSPQGDRAFAKYRATEEGALATFVRNLWQRYAPAGKVGALRAIEIYNEPNAKPAFIGKWADYVHDAEIVYRETKAIAPDALVVGISLSGGMHQDFVDGVLDHGLGRYMDIASLHLYEIGVPSGFGSIERKVTLFSDALKRLEIGGMPVWNTESGAKLNIRRGGIAVTQEELNKYYKALKGFNSSRPWVVAGHWVGVSEELSTAWMIRTSIQQLALGVEKNFYFQWADDPLGWVTGFGDGNPMPRLKIPAQAVLSKMWQKFGGGRPETLVLQTSNPDLVAYGYRFTGDRHRLTVIFTHPKGADRSTGDENVAHLDEGGPSGGKEPRSVRYHPFLREEAPPSVHVSIDARSENVTVIDWLDRKQQDILSVRGHVDIPVSERPTYLVEEW